MDQYIQRFKEFKDSEIQIQRFKESSYCLLCELFSSVWPADIRAPQFLEPILFSLALKRHFLLTTSISVDLPTFWRFLSPAQNSLRSNLFQDFIMDTYLKRISNLARANSELCHQTCPPPPSKRQAGNILIILVITRPHPLVINLSPSPVDLIL